MSENSSAAPEEVLTAAEAARILRVSLDVMYALLSRGEVPARRVGHSWRISRTRLLEWLMTAPVKTPTQPAPAPTPAPAPAEPLSRAHVNRRPLGPRDPSAPPRTLLDRLKRAVGLKPGKRTFDRPEAGLITMTEAGRRCGLPVHAIRRLADANAIPAVHAGHAGRVVRIPEAEFMRWLREPVSVIDPSVKRSRKGYAPRGHAITMLVAEARMGARSR